MYVAYHSDLYKVEDFKKEVDGIWLTLEGLGFRVKADWVIII